MSTENIEKAKYEIAKDPHAAINKLERRRQGRRKMLKTAGLAGAAALGAGLLGETQPKAEAAVAVAFGPKGKRFVVNDYDILNFALNLEYLEAEFYVRAATNAGLLAADLTPGSASKTAQGTVSGGVGVPFNTSAVREYASHIATDEYNHVKFLRSALGKHAVAEPTINLDTIFPALATAAGIPDGADFSPYTGDVPFLLGAFIFEDVGVTAYHGAAAAIRNPTYLTAAAGILAVEAYHASEVRLQIIEAGQPYIQYGNLISSFRNAASAAADGVALTDQGLLYSDGTFNVVPTDSNSIAFARSFAAVLNIVYGNATALPDKGGFFRQRPQRPHLVDGHPHGGLIGRGCAVRKRPPGLARRPFRCATAERWRQTGSARRVSVSSLPTSATKSTWPHWAQALAFSSMSPVLSVRNLALVGRK